MNANIRQHYTEYNLKYGTIFFFLPELCNHVVISGGPLSVTDLNAT